MSNPQPAVSRRTLVGAIGATAAALAVAPATSAAAAAPTPAPSPAGAAGSAGRGPRTVSVPATRAQSAAGAEATTVRPGFPIRYVGVSWDGPARGAAIRLHRDGGAPGAWQPLPAGCAGGPDEPAQTARSAAATATTTATALIAAGGAPGYDLRLPDGAGNVRTAAIDTVHGPVRSVALAPTAPVSFCGVEYLSRAAWGADETKRFKNGVENSPAKYYPLQTLTVHHTDTPNADPDPAATVRAIYEYHAITNDWGDIGYHFLIDEAGRIYEGRWSGDDGIPAHDASGNVVTAFHTAGFNSGNLGIALLGTLSNQAPTAPARRALTGLLSVLARTHQLDPQAHTTFVNPVNGVTKPVDMISGHRDWLATDCPGGTIYADLPVLRADVAALGGGTAH
ncbi:peptidoglycan recognition protein family protein [Kitasatospora sp. NBC_01560]|uniref:peptidoglycan recognition protein family protein n=1 Tax=Kitasatospora sp. NBC_01560 TaxID=2975965 RepID=UPI00386EDC8E